MTALVLVLPACAAEKSRLVSDNQVRNLCPVHLTYSCVEYMGKRLRCTCSSRDSLEAILEPEQY